jgi:hypothetical protein
MEKKIEQKIKSLEVELSKNTHPNFSAVKAIELTAKIAVLKEINATTAGA